MAGTARRRIRAAAPIMGAPLALACLLTLMPAAAAATAPTLQTAPFQRAGYTASGRDFRFAQAVINVPRQRCVAEISGPAIFVALSGPGGSARAGITCSGSHPGWRAFVAVASAPAGHPAVFAFPLPRASAGSPVFTSVYRARQAIRAVIVLASGKRYARTVPAWPPARTPAGSAFTQAQALATWPATDRTLPAPGRETLLTRFTSGGFTDTAGGRGVFTGPYSAKGHLSSHPWTLRHLNASWPAMGGHATASYLWTDGTQAAFGGLGNAFGIWLSA